jgi:cytochrome c oxidase subunit III
MAQSSVGSASRREVSPLLFGTILFLASELLFFGGLFAAYFALRAETAPWPPEVVHLDIPLAAVATAVLVVSSFTFQAGITAGRRRSAGAMRAWIGASLALGLAFLGMQGYDWLHLDFSVATDAYGTMFYAMTGFHALHVLAGLLLMLVVLGREAQGAYGGGDLTGAEAVAYYWHFVDVVWVALFATLFLLR